MYIKEKILKDKKSSSGRDITEPTRDGELFILMVRTTRRKDLKEWTEIMDSIS
jgi:hypothetical protein